MRRGFRWPLLVEVLLAGVMLGLILGSIVLIRTLRYGFSTFDDPTHMEALMASEMRRLSVPADLRKLPNPIVLTPSVLDEAEGHFADHCATCHGNDGKGKTELGMHLYPRAPDLTLADTQQQSDGELFATIENGVRLTGMPGWGDGTAASAYGSWTLVHLIRHLPKMTQAEVERMKTMNPISPGEMEEQKAAAMQEEEFLNGDGATPPSEEHTHAH